MVAGNVNPTNKLFDDTTPTVVVICGPHLHYLNVPGGRNLSSICGVELHFKLNCIGSEIDKNGSVYC